MVYQNRNKMTQVIKIEKRNKRVASCISSINRIIERNGNNKLGCLRDLLEIIGEAWDLKLGYGGSHIWCANKKNERVFIIEGY